MITPTPPLFSKILMLGEAEVRRCLPMSTTIAANRKALGALRKSEDGGAMVPTRIALPYRDKNHNGDVSQDWTLFKPAAYYPKPDPTSAPRALTTDKDTVLMGMKLVSVRPKNASRGLPTVPATVMLLDAKTGEVNAILGGTYLTAVRTAAGSAVATELCTRDVTDPINLVVFGAGLQAEAHIEAIRSVKLVWKVTIVNRTLQRAEELKARILAQQHAVAREHMDSTWALMTSNQIDVVPLGDNDGVRSAVRDADVIVTCTNSAAPLFDGRLVKSGCHINSIGSFTPSMREVDKTLVNRSQVLVDTWEALESGDLKHLAENVEDDLSANVVGLLGDLIVGNASLRAARLETISSKVDCTLFKSVGTAIQDIVTAQEVLKCAQERGIGTKVEM